MSRTLTRLRSATGDPLLVRAGRGMVPTPRALALRDRVHDLAREARAVLRPQADHVDIAALERIFTLRASEGFMEFLATSVVAALSQAAPSARLRFVAKPDKDATPLRAGWIEMEIGVAAANAPEIRRQFLFRDRFVAVARLGHPLLEVRPVTPAAYAACRHVAASREGAAGDIIDAGLKDLGLFRTVTVVVPGYPDAMRIVRQSDMVAVVPRSCLGHGSAGREIIRDGLESFELPVPVPEVVISAMWHPRMEADPAHRWLRETVTAVCRAAYPRR